MRQLATMSSADTARKLADYLLTLKIETRLDKQPDGWAVWVCDEDQLPRARQEFEEFSRNPANPRYTAAPQEANSLRQRKRQEEQDYQRRQRRFQRRMSGPGDSQPLTIGLILICILVSLASSGGYDAKIVPALSISPYRLIDDNLIEWPELTPILHGQIWRLVTPIFLHFGIWHLLFDMYWLHYLGGAIERVRGPLRYLALVLIVAVISNLVQYYFGNPDLSGGQWRFLPLPFFGGMSGVNYGLFGYIWMKARFQPEAGLIIGPRLVIFMMVWFVLCMTPVMHVLIGGGVANGAHAGGLVAGMLIGYVPTLWRSSSST
ncbi:MAG: rhomboid family intramembrane serine protease [Gemmataceae bacterium]